MAAARGGVLDARAAREAEVAALPHDAGAQVLPVDPDRVAGAVGSVGVGGRKSGMERLITDLVTA